MRMTFPHSRRHPRPCAEDLITSNRIETLQMLGTSPSMTEEGIQRRFVRFLSRLYSNQIDAARAFVVTANAFCT
jgi:hypothetical protein